MAIFSRDAKVGQVFARETALAEVLRRFVRAQDFFSEFRHQGPPAAVRDAAESGVKIPAGEAYNILDTYHVLRLDDLHTVTYDATLVRGMRRGDLSAVMAVARKVYQIDSDRWLRAQYDSGDIGFVARVERQVVGFAFASIVNGVGRLHTLTVLPEHRNRGIGRELIGARLHALQAVGARYVLSEIATWNLPSLQLAYANGFSKVADMWVETTRAKPVQFGLQRR
jgi:GNAT superfamily N-acetyltransferase